MLQQNMVTTVKACCIIHGKVCCNSLMQRFLATRVHHCNKLLQHLHTIATICCNTSNPFVATPAILFQSCDNICCNVLCIFQRNKKKHTNAKHYIVSISTAATQGGASSHVLIILNVVLLIYIPVVISLVIIADTQVLRAIDRSACVVGDATVFVR